MANFKSLVLILVSFLISTILAFPTAPSNDAFMIPSSTVMPPPSGTVDKRRATCTLNGGLLVSCGNGSPASPSIPLPSDYRGGHCGTSSTAYGSTKNNIHKAIAQFCQSKFKHQADMQIISPDSSFTLVNTLKSVDGNQITLQLQPDWLAIAPGKSFRYTGYACEAGFKAAVLNCGTHDKPLISTGLIDSTIDHVPVRFWVSIVDGGSNRKRDLPSPVIERDASPTPSSWSALVCDPQNDVSRTTPENIGYFVNTWCSTKAPEVLDPNNSLLVEKGKLVDGLTATLQMSVDWLSAPVQELQFNPTACYQGFMQAVWLCKAGVENSFMFGARVSGRMDGVVITFWTSIIPGSPAKTSASTDLQ